MGLRGDDVVVASIEEAELHMPHPPAPTLRAAFEDLDHIQPCDHFRLRASVMKSVPKFLRGQFKNALKVALEAATDPNCHHTEPRLEVALDVAENVAAQTTRQR